MRIQVQGISKKYGERMLFSIPSLEIGSGQSLHLQGENGAGKTTLMKILAGLERPSSGSIILNGIDSRSWWKRPHYKVIYLHQTPFVFSGSVSDNVRFGLGYQFSSRRDLDKRVAAVLELAGLTQLAMQEARTLSGGEKQRLALARAAILEPSMLMLDEPTANLDAESIKIVTEMVTSLSAQECCIMLSSHQKTSLTQLCQRQLQLKAGQLLEVFANPEYSKYA